MTPLTTRERITRMYEHREADRVPICDTPWAATVERWQREGMPAGTDINAYFGLDPVHLVKVDISPRYEQRIVEQTDEYITRATAWGSTERNWKHSASTPEYLDFTVTDPDAWAKARARMTPTPDRIPWKWLENDYPRLRERGDWMQARFWFGFEAVHAFTVGTERVLMALCTDPEWMTDMFNHYLDMNIALFETILARGYTFDAISWTDDLAYKLSQFFSVSMYRELLKPTHRRAVEWAHSKGMKAKFHSCGDIRPFLPEFVDMGIDGLHPLEVKAGVDPIEVKRGYGRQLLLHGGIDALLWEDANRMEAYIERVLPIMMEGGGYIFSTDHTIPSSASLKDFRFIVERVKELGAYR